MWLGSKTGHSQAPALLIVVTADIIISTGVAMLEIYLLGVMS